LSEDQARSLLGLEKTNNSGFFDSIKVKSIILSNYDTSEIRKQFSVNAEDAPNIALYMKHIINLYSFCDSGSLALLSELISQTIKEVMNSIGKNLKYYMIKYAINKDTKGCVEDSTPLLSNTPVDVAKACGIQELNSLEKWYDGVIYNKEDFEYICSMINLAYHLLILKSTLLLVTLQCINTSYI
jgi:hypothetical protein